MRILVLNYEFPPLGGGAGDVTRALSHEYAKKGHSVKVITSYYKTLPRYELISEYEVYRVNAFRKYAEKSNIFQMFCFLVGAFRLFIKICREWKPDIIHSHFLVPTSFLAYIGWKRYRIPYIVSLHGGDIPSFISEQTASVFMFVKHFAEIFGRNAKKMIAVSGDLELLAKNDYKELSQNIIHIDNGVNLNTYGIRNKFQIPTFLFVGRLSIQKNLVFLIKALSYVKKDFHLIILGDGPERTRLEELLRKNKIRDNVEFKGWVSRKTVAEYMQRSHFLVLPSLAEGMPMAGLQAYSLGLPVIGTRVTGLKDFIEDGKSGYLVELENEIELSELISTLCDHPKKSLEMSDYCLGLVREKYEWPKIADKYLNIIGESI
ncbi:MAG: glycosyltransferase family 4 protein [Candidatus Scalindua sp.]